MRVFNQSIHSLSTIFHLKVLTIFICLDILALFLHIFYRLDYLPYRFFSLEKDACLGEIIQYVKYGMIIYYMLAVKKHQKQYSSDTPLLVYSVWAFIFTYIFLDDMLKGHEKIGGFVAQSFSYTDAYGLRAQDFGELTFIAFLGMATFIAAIFAYVRSETFQKKLTIAILVHLMVFACFAAGGDAIHSMVKGEVAHKVIGAIEDFGELIVMSFLCAYIVFFSQHQLTKKAL